MARVVVIGGGLAGGAAALALAETGATVKLIEKRSRLGGRACSYLPPGWPHAVDNSQHVLLRCCTNLLDFYRRLGVADRVRWHDRVTLVADDRTSVFRAWPLPPPLHLAPALAALPGLSGGDRARLALAFTRLLLAGRRRERLSARPFRDWLGPATSPTLDSGFWRLMLTSVLNADADRVGADYAAMFFLDGLLRHREAYHLGVPETDLSALHHDALLARLAELGVEVRFGTPATVELDAGAVAAVRAGERLPADQVVVAVPWPHLRRTVPELPPDALAVGDRFATASIVGVHFRFEQPVVIDPVTGFLDGDVDWVFALDGGRHLSLVASDARSWAGLSAEAMARRGWAALRAWRPELPEPVLQAACRETLATFVPAPHIDLHRPPARTAVAGLHLAGEWTATRWPSTMESAVRSGYAAAASVTGQRFLEPDLPRQGLMRWFLDR